jgi:hypothetical protein
MNSNSKGGNMLINIVIGNKLNENMDNIESLESNAIPQIGSRIVTKKFGQNTVKDVLIDYRQMQEDDGKGLEWVFVFI